MRKVLLVLALFFYVSEANAQNIPATATTCTNAAISAGTASCIILNVAGQGTIGIQITGTWTGTITFSGSLGQNGADATFVSALADPIGSTIPVSTTTANGIWSIPAAGFNQIKVAVTTTGSGTASVNWRITNQAKGLSGGSGGGAVTCADCATEATLQGVLTSTNFAAAFGTAGTADTQVMSVQGIASMTPLLATVSDGAGALNTIVDSGTLTAVTSISNPVTITDGAGALNTIVDSGTLTTVSTLTTITNPVTVTATNLDVQSGGADLATQATLVTLATDPCTSTAKSFHVVNMSTATTVEIANAVSAQFWYICGVNLVAAAAQTIAIGIDDTDGCGSITTGLHGGATAATGWSFAANGGIALGNGQGTIMKAATADRYLCIITGQAAQISGTISYVSAP